MPKSRKKKSSLREKKHKEEEIMKMEDDYQEVSEAVVEEEVLEDEESTSSLIKVPDLLIEEEEHVDIVIEIDEKESTSDEKQDNIINDIDNIVLSKHSEQGKHSLKYDSIFKGKKEDPLEEMSGTSTYFNDNFDVDKGSTQWLESMDNERYNREKKVKERIYDILLKNTDVSFSTNRRKPSKEDFNRYYSVLKEHLINENFSNVEVFNELAVYFSDNLFNMFKLLDNKWKTLIVQELQNHIGEHKTEEIINRNISYGTEVEFSHIDINIGSKLITGVVIKCHYESSEYTVDSYKNIYTVKIETITKILNNRKFKYNLNKLNGIDFL